MSPPPTDSDSHEAAAPLPSDPASLEAVIVTRQALIAELRVGIAELERQPGLNSGNSGKPPSSDGLKKQWARISSLRERSRFDPPGFDLTWAFRWRGVYTPCLPTVDPIRIHDRTEMIARLTGVVDALEDGRCVIDVPGVGELVPPSTRTLAALPRPPELAKLLIETHVREDAIQLFGFTDTAERDWFRLLTTVQGVGPRVGLSILSALSPRDLIGAIAARDQASLTRAPGVGARLAARLLTELKDKVGAMPSSPGPGIAMPPVVARGAAGAALSALINLGYRRRQAPAASRPSLVWKRRPGRRSRRASLPLSSAGPAGR